MNSFQSKLSLPRRKLERSKFFMNYISRRCLFFFFHHAAHNSTQYKSRNFFKTRITVNRASRSLSLHYNTTTALRLCLLYGPSFPDTWSLPSSDDVFFFLIIQPATTRRHRIHWRECIYTQAQLEIGARSFSLDDDKSACLPAHSDE